MGVEERGRPREGSCAAFSFYAVRQINIKVHAENRHANAVRKTLKMKHYDGGLSQPDIKTYSKTFKLKHCSF